VKTPKQTKQKNTLSNTSKKEEETKEITIKNFFVWLSSLP
jgi:hypothetical protein